MSYSNNGAASSFAENRYKLGLGPIEEANFKGELYYVRHRFTGVATGTHKDIVVSVGANNLFLAGRSFSQTTDRMELEVYVNPSFSGGTAIVPSAYNGITPVLPALTTAVSDPTVTDVGILFDEFLFLGDPNNKPNRVGGSFRTNDVLRMVPTNTNFLLRVHNEGTIAMDCLIKYLFFERNPTIPLS